MAASPGEIHCLLRRLLLLLRTNRVQDGAAINCVQREIGISVAAEVFRLVEGMDSSKSLMCA